MTKKVLLNQLFADALAGSIDAFGHVIERHRSYLMLLTRVKLRMGTARTDASDIVQEAFVNAIRGFENFRGATESEFAAWLRTILARCIVDYLRKKSLGSDQNTMVELVAAELDQTSAQWTAKLVSPCQDPGMEAERRESLFLLAEALDKLPNDYREAIVLIGNKNWQQGQAR